MVYRRSQWNVLISDVNNIRASPPDNTDCSPLPPIDELPPNTIWRKTHVTQVRNALAETCPSISFGGIPDLWLDDIEAEIRAQFGIAWCDCEEDEDCPPGTDPTGENGQVFELFTQGLEVFSNCSGYRFTADSVSAESLVAPIDLEPAIAGRSWSIRGYRISDGATTGVLASGIVECSGNLFVMNDTGNIVDATGILVSCSECGTPFCEEGLADAEADLDPGQRLVYKLTIFALSANCRDCVS